MGYIRKFLGYLSHAMERSLLHSEHQLTVVGAVGFFGFPLFYFIWAYVFPQPWESLSLRMVGSLLCGGLMLKNFWPRPLRKYMPYYWYVTILYSLPFFFFLAYLKSDGAIIPAMATLVSVFLMILLVDWISLIFLLSAGVTLASIAYYFSTPNPTFPPNMIPYTAVYLFTVVAGTIFNYKTSLLHQHRLEGMAAITGNVAHELRTPLLGIKSGIEGLRRYFPILRQSYEMAREKGLDVPRIRLAHLDNILPALDRMEGETHFANTIIDMLLMNVGKREIDKESFQVCWIRDCVEEALHRYPFDSAEQEAKIHWEDSNNFQYRGSSILMVHVLFNLIKNALHFIVKAEKGEIFIWFEQNKKWNELHFKDTGMGISERVLPRIFDRFYTTTITGTGIGLAYCKIVIQSFGGDISCRSEFGKYAEFILSFPKLTEKE